MIQKLIDAYELEREMYCKCIDTDEEIKKGRAKWDSGLWIRYRVFEETITLAPRVDAVRHGHWIKANDPMSSPFDTMKRCLCSECREWGSVTSYCPNCGAKMDEVEE